MRHLLFLLLALGSAAQAAPTTMPIPGQNWQISFDAPVLNKMKEQSRPGQFVYVGNAGKFNLSLHVEDPGCSGGTTHRAYYECFWPKASRNPMIAQETVVATEGPRYYKVAFDIHAPWQGRILVLKNLNYLIAYRGKWIDLHVSVVDPQADDLAMLEALEKSLVYDETPAPK